MRHEGVTCPTCGQYAKVYRRRLNGQMAKALIAIYRAAAKDWVHIRTIVGSARADEAKLRYWGLLEEGNERREDGGRAGYWRVTDDGEKFILLRLAVPTYALVYDGQCIDHDGPDIDIKEALATRFNYAELMSQ
jgi:hypothetical protein